MLLHHVTYGVHENWLKKYHIDTKSQTACDSKEEKNVHNPPSQIFIRENIDWKLCIKQLHTILDW